MADSLHALLTELRSGKYPQPESGAFTAIPLARASRHFAAISSDGAPSILLRAKGDRQQAVMRPLRLQGLAVQYSVLCRVTIGSAAAHDEILTTVACTSGNPLEQDYFLHAAEIILRIVGAEPGIDEIVSATSHLASLFQRLSRPPRQSVTGMIGELMLIFCAAVPEQAISAWRSDPSNRYDFICGNLRLEVKATEQRQRAHYVSYDQCHPPDGTIGILASLVVESAGGGASVAELIEGIEARIAGNIAATLRLHEVIADTLGQALIGALGERFDRQLARATLFFFDLRRIPAIRDPLPLGVTDVRFISHLGTAAPLDIEGLRLQEQERMLFPDAAR
jgi:hypothetical protein